MANLAVGEQVRLLFAGGYFWLYAAIIPYHLNEASFRILLPTYLQSVGFGLEIIGLLVALYSVASLLSRLPVGLLYQRDRARWIAAGCLIIMGVLSLVYPLLAEAWAIGVLRIVQGALMGTAGTLHLALFLEARPPGIDRGRATSIHAMTTTTAYLVGNFGAGALADGFGYPVAFAVAGGGALVGGLMTLLIRFPPQPAPTASVAAAAPFATGVTAGGAVVERSGAPAATAPTPSAPVPSSPRAAVGRLARQWGIQQTCLASLVANVVVDMTWNFIPLWGVASGHSLAAVGGVRSLGNVAGFFSRGVAGELGRLTGWGVMSAGSLLVLGFVVVAVPVSEALLYLGLMCALVATIRGMLTVANNVVLMEETDVDPSLRGMGSAMIHMSRDVGAILGPLIGGIVAAQVGLDNMFRLVPIPFIVLYVPLLVAELRLHRRATRAALSP